MQCKVHQVLCDATPESNPQQKDLLPANLSDTPHTQLMHAALDGDTLD